MAAREAVPVTISLIVVAVGGNIGPASGVWVVPARLLREATILKTGNIASIVVAMAIAKAVSTVATHSKDL
jgi:hypothetical protein